MKTITIELSKQSCSNALKELKKYNNFKQKLDEVCRRLAEIGAQEANAHLILANGNTDAAISVEQIDGGYKLVMSGSDVYFIEFGTGNQVSTHFDTSVPVSWGTWSAEHEQRLWNYGFWYFGGERLEGTPAYMPMYYAGKAIRENEKRIAQEVLGK